VATLKDLKRRIRSVQSTKQITKAMEMVAAAKLRRAQANLGAARPYANKMNDVLRLLASNAAASEHPYFRVREGRTAMLIVSSDRGLCGSFNVNIGRTVEAFLETRRRDEVELVGVGKKTIAYLRHRGWRMRESFIGLGDQVDLPMVQRIARSVTSLYDSEEVARVVIASTRFVSPTRRSAEILPFLPVEPGADQGAPRDYLFEPDVATILEALLPRYVTAFVYAALAQSFAAEHGARMIAMGNATRNAGDLIDTLVLKRNRLRQAAITSELADIVGTAEAVT
jgi:F-type H+-transporting ATPase subunit gamma